MNAPRIAKAIRRCGLAVCRLAKPFTPRSEEEKLVQDLLSEAQWSSQLDQRTDREIGTLAARMMDFEPGTVQSSLLTELIDRLVRSPGGPNTLDDRGNRIFGIALNVRLIPNIACDGCHSIGYVCDRSRLCLYCLGLKVSVERRRQMLTMVLDSDLRPRSHE